MASLEARRRYVRLLINQGCNVQPGQQVLLVAEPASLDLLEWAAEACYERGARYVDYNLVVPRLERTHARLAPSAGLTFAPLYRTVQMEQLVDCQGARLSLLSQDEPDLYEDFDGAGLHRVNAAQLARRSSLQRFLEEGLLRGGASWCGAGPPSPKWACKVFPELPETEAVDALWDEILAMTCADREDCEERWAAHLEALEARARRLDGWAIRELHFVNPSRGTDLRVSLSAAARWAGGRSLTRRGVAICPNIPTFEVFTTPDWRRTHGTVGTTRPVMINGSLVEGLWLRFEDGQLSEVRADRNGAAYEALIGSEPGARRLGEVALVGVDSPIYRCGRVFGHTLYDENAACHIATGLAYTSGLVGGGELSGPELDELGCNREARTHQDVMISDETTSVYADGRELLVEGRWVI